MSTISSPRHIEAWAGIGHEFLSFLIRFANKNLRTLDPDSLSQATRSVLRFPTQAKQFACSHARKPPSVVFLRRGRESNPRMSVLQTEALPLRHHALSTNYKGTITIPHRCFPTLRSETSDCLHFACAHATSPPRLIYKL